MAPPTKYSAEQIELMQTFHDQFLECKAKKNYEPLWNPFFEAWGEKFPERTVVFPDIPLDVDLTKEQSAVLSKAWALRQQRLMEKFRNDLGGSKAGWWVNGKHTATVNKMMKNILTKDSTHKPTRVLKPWEMYLKTHYTKVKDAVKTEQEELKNAPFAEPAKKTALCVVRWHLKSVEAMKEKRHTEIEEAKKQNHDKEVIHSYISKIAAILSQFFEELHEMTDWVFTVLMGGPHPAAGGTLDISSFHIGTTKPGNQFSQAYPQFSQNIMVPYTAICRTRFFTRYSVLMPFQTADAAALSRAKSLLPASDTSSTLAVTPGPSSAHLASDILPSTPSNTGTMATSDTLFSSELLNLMEGVNTFRFSSEPYASLPPMDTDNDTSQLSLPILPMPPQLLSQPPHETLHSLNQFLQDPSPEDFAQQYLSPISTSPLQIQYEIQNTPILTGDESANNPNKAGAQPQPYYATDPTFIFPNSTPPPSQAHSTHILSATTPPATPAGTPPTQTLTSPSDAAPIGHPSDTGKKHGYHQNGRGKRQWFQSKRAAEANNIGGSSTTQKTGCK
ncbi:hypothetical protein F4604DRAFT_1676684 [Suillus subluteus]|nr:hypothetical protein F4604DRAFT_1676684 [Suillus subluteus]